MRKDADPTPWNTGRATFYGALVGFAAAAFKLATPWSGPHSPLQAAEELIGAALAFALLCGLAASLRNVIVR